MTTKEPKEAGTVQADRQIAALRYSPCGRFLAAGGYGPAVWRWKADGGRDALPPLTGHRGWVTALAFHSDRERLFTADSWGELRCRPYAEDGPRPLWVREKAHDGWVRDMAVNADGSLLATCGSDRVVRVWSADGEASLELDGHGGDVYAVAFHPGGGGLASGDLFGRVIVWDLQTGREVRRFDAATLHAESRLQNVGGVRRLAFDAEGATLAVAGTTPKNGGNVQGTPTVLLFDWATGRVRQEIKVGQDKDAFAHDLAFHPDGFLAGVTSGNPGVGQFFLHRPGEDSPFFLSTKMPNCHALALHPDGRGIAVAATNGGSAGNGRRLGKEGEYQGNFSPIHFWELG